MDESWHEDILSALEDFRIVSRLAKGNIVLGTRDVEFLPAPHRPRTLPPGRMALYGFWFNGEWLKIGQAGPKSNARYMSQHYTGSAQSTLSGSLRNDTSMRSIAGLEVDALTKWSAWIKRETNRVNILLPSTQSKSLVSLLESFLHARLHPRYEG